MKNDDYPLFLLKPVDSLIQMEHMYKIVYYRKEGKDDEWIRDHLNLTIESHEHYKKISLQKLYFWL